MFTGIITGVGRIAAVHDLGSSSAHGKRLAISAPPGYLDDVGLGDSIALNGACMTVTSFDAAASQFTIDMGPTFHGMLIGLQHNGAGAFTHHKAIPVQVKRAGSGEGIIIAFRKGFHGVETAHTGFVDHVFGTAGHDRTGTGNRWCPSAASR